MQPRNNDVFTPSQLNTLARDLLEGSFPAIWVEAELGSVARPASGHLYFTLKDARAQLRAAMFRMKAQYLKFVPREGMRVLVRGKVTLYDARGEYQMVLDHMEEAGEGALRRAFEELKARLEAEGYVAFSPEKHSFERQVATYLGARHIIGQDSSALHLVGFAAPPEAEVGILLRRPGGERDMLPQLTGFMGRKPLVVDAIARLIRRDNERNPNWSMFAELDLQQLHRDLRDAGFIAGQVPWPALPRVLRR